MRPTWLALLVLAACDDAGWDGAVADFEDGRCTTTCSALAEDACRNEVQTALAAAQAVLDPAGEQRCIDCLDAQLRLFPLLEQQSCRPTADQAAEILATCGSNDEACGGLP